jgi:membrane protein implicated in regulation of membrane protease activity
MGSIFSMIVYALIIIALIIVGLLIFCIPTAGIIFLIVLLAVILPKKRKAKKQAPVSENETPEKVEE